MVFLLLRAIIITIIAQLYPPTRHTSRYLLESSGLPLPGTYTTTISGQCSARGNCPLSAHLRWGRTKNTPCIFSKYTRGKDLFKKKKFSPKGAKYSAALFYCLLFLKTGLHQQQPDRSQPPAAADNSLTKRRQAALLPATAVYGHRRQTDANRTTYRRIFQPEQQRSRPVNDRPYHRDQP